MSALEGWWRVSVLHQIEWAICLSNGQNLYRWLSQHDKEQINSFNEGCQQQNF